MLLIYSCSPKVIYRGDAGAGGFAQVKCLTHNEKDIFQSDNSNEHIAESLKKSLEVNHSIVNADTPKLSKAQLKAKKKRIALGFSVDTVPPPAMRNRADKQLARAQLWLDRYERNQVNQKINLATYFTITTPPTTAAIIALESAMVGSSKYVLYQILLVFGGIMVLGTWLSGFVIISLLPEFKRGKAYRKILNSPKKAPEGRQLEYEIRMLLMLNNVMSREEQIRRIQKIREVSQSDLYNPWLSRLKELKYYKESSAKLKKSISFWAFPKFMLYLYLAALLFAGLVSLF